MRSRVVIILVPILLLTACSIMDSDEDPLRIVDDPHVEVNVSPAAVCGTETIVDCIVSFGQYDEWHYHWELEGEYEESFAGSKLRWIPPLGPEQQLLRVTVSNDTQRYLEQLVVDVAQPGVPVVYLEPESVQVHPEDGVGIRCHSKDDRFALSYEWSTTQGIVSQGIGQDRFHFRCRQAGEAIVQVNVANLAFSASVCCTLNVMQLPPRFLGEFCDPATGIHAGESFEIGVAAYDPNDESVQLGFEVPQGIEVLASTVEEHSLFLRLSAEAAGTYTIVMTASDGHSTSTLSQVVEVLEVLEVLE